MKKFGLLLIFSSALATCCRAQEACILPDKARQSECIRFYHCESFAKIVRESGGNPTPAVADNLRRHYCPKSGFVCCPDNAVPITTTTTARAIAATPISSFMTPGPVSLELPTRSNLNTVSAHANFGLLNQKCGTSSSNRIIGGFRAEPGEFPWMALLQYKSRLTGSLTFNCGGTLISSYYVLTAAHCLNRDLVGVRLGEHDISTEVDCESQFSCKDPQDPVQDILVEEQIKHKKYDRTKKFNDIALLRLVSPADTNKKNVKTICLPLEQANQLENLDQVVLDSLTISGWGRVESGNTSDVLLKAFVPYVPKSRCGDIFRTLRLPIYETYLCAGGGPIQGYGPVGGRFGKAIQYGVVSLGVACDNPQVIYPGIYTNIAYYLTWILDNMVR